MTASPGRKLAGLALSRTSWDKDGQEEEGRGPRLLLAAPARPMVALQPRVPHWGAEWSAGPHISVTGGHASNCAVEIP